MVRHNIGLLCVLCVVVCCAPEAESSSPLKTGTFSIEKRNEFSVPSADCSAFKPRLWKSDAPRISKRLFRAITPTSLVVAGSHQLKTVEIREDGSVRVAGAVQTAGAVVDLQVLGSKAVVVQYFGHHRPFNGTPDILEGSVISLVDVSQIERPRLLKRLRFFGRAEATHVVDRDGRIEVYVVVNDESDWCDGITGTRLMGFSATDRDLVLNSDVMLRDDKLNFVAAVRAYDDVLLVARSRDAWGRYSDYADADGGQEEPGQTNAEVAVLRLKPGEAPAFEAHFAVAGRIEAIGLTSNILRVVSVSEASIVVTAYDTSDVSSLTKLSSCNLGGTQTGTPREVAVVGERTFVSRWTSLEIGRWSPDRGCETQMLDTEGGGMILPSPDETRVAYILDQQPKSGSRQRNLVSVYWLDATGEHENPLLASQTGIGSLRAQSWDLQASTWVSRQALQPDSPASSQVLFVPSRDRSLAGQSFESLLPLEMSDDAINMLGRIRDRAGAFVLADRVLALAGDTELALRESAMGDDLASLILDEPLEEAIAFDTMIARIRPAITLSDNNNPDATVEMDLVAKPGGHTSVSKEKIRVSEYSELHRAGTSLVVTSPVIQRTDSDTLATALNVDVYDLNGRASLEYMTHFAASSPKDEFCEKFNACALQKHVDMSSTAQAIVISEDTESRIEFQILDLSDRHAPLTKLRRFGESALVRAIPTNNEIIYLYSVAHGPTKTEFYGFYKSHGYDIEVEATTVEYFATTLSLQLPEQPSFAYTQSVPGDILANGPNGFYASQTVEVNGERETLLHRLSMYSGQSTVYNTANLDDVDVDSVEVNGNVLVVQTRPSWKVAHEQFGDDAPEKRATTMVVLDPVSLSVLGRFELEPEANLQSVRENKALFTSSSGIGVLDLADPRAPRLQRFDWAARPKIVEFDGKQIIASDDRRMLVIDATKDFLEPEAHDE